MTEARSEKQNDVVRGKRGEKLGRSMKILRNEACEIKLLNGKREGKSIQTNIQADQ